MFGKRLRFMTMMAAAVGIPYAWFNENFAAPLKSSWRSLKGEYVSMSRGAAHEGGMNEWPLLDRSAATSANAAAVHAAPGTPTSYDLSEVLRFDVTPRWITERWGRVSTVRSEQDLEGLRVPLVSGTGIQDITGALTYYFDRQQRVRRLTLRGQTGDERGLVQLAAQRFGLKPEPSLAAGMYVARWNGHPTNVLRVTHAPVIRAATPNTRLYVELEINDPGGGYGLSRELLQSLRHDTHAKRWGVN